MAFFFFKATYISQSVLLKKLERHQKFPFYKMYTLKFHCIFSDLNTRNFAEISSAGGATFVLFHLLQYGAHHWVYPHQNFLFIGAGARRGYSEIVCCFPIIIFLIDFYSDHIICLTTSIIWLYFYCLCTTLPSLVQSDYI